jgi:hypothetical protein
MNTMNTTTTTTTTKLDEAIERLANEIAHSQAVANGTHICNDTCLYTGGTK